MRQVKPDRSIPIFERAHLSNSFGEGVQFIWRHCPIQLAALSSWLAVCTGITDPGRIATIQAHADSVFVTGTTPGYRAKLDLSEPPPPLQQTLQQSHMFDLQQAQERQQEQTRQQQLRQ